MNMTSELYYAALSCGLTSLLWIPYTTERLRIIGLKVILSYPKGTGPVDPPETPNWAKRGHRAHNNMIESLLPFLGLVLIMNSLGFSSDLTVFGAALFFWSRVFYLVCYYFRIPALRTLTYSTGWVGTMIFMYEIFSSIEHVG